MTHPQHCSPLLPALEAPPCSQAAAFSSSFWLLARHYPSTDACPGPGVSLMALVHLLAGDGSQLGLTGTERPLEAKGSTALVAAKLPWEQRAGLLGLGEAGWAVAEDEPVT